MNKTFLVLGSFLVFVVTLLAFSTHVYAGGGNILLHSLNFGIAKHQGVEIIVTVFDPFTNTLDWPELAKYGKGESGYEPIGIEGLETEVSFQSPKTGQYCEMKGDGITNNFGQVRAVCYSDSVGEFIVDAKFKTDKPIYNGGPSATTVVRMMAISFYPAPFPTTSPTQQPKASLWPPVPSESPTPKATPKPTPTTVVLSEDYEKLEQLEAQNQEQKEQIEALIQKVDEQQTEVSALKKVIARIQDFLSKFFR